MKIQELTKAIYNEFKNKVKEPITTVELAHNYYVEIDLKSTDVKIFFKSGVVRAKYKDNTNLLIDELEAELAQANLLIEAKEPIALAV